MSSRQATGRIIAGGLSLPFIRPPAWG